MRIYLLKMELFFRSKGAPIDIELDIVESQPTNELAKSVAEQVNRIFLANLAADYPHLFEAQVCSNFKLFF